MQFGGFLEEICPKSSMHSNDSPPELARFWHCFFSLFLLHRCLQYCLIEMLDVLCPHCFYDLFFE